MQKATAALIWIATWIPWALGSLLGCIGIPFTYSGVMLIDWAESHQEKAKRDMESL